MRVFVPAPGQIDYTHAKEAPVLNCLGRHGSKILIVKRSEEVGFYPGFWHGIAGFLDDHMSPEEKAKKELAEETGIGPERVIGISTGPVIRMDDPQYGKIWHVHTLLADVDTDKVDLNWEATEYRWVEPNELEKYELVPGFRKVVESWFKEA